MVSQVTLKMEKKYFSKNLVAVGLDEVGRGAWAGPVCVGAVVYAPGVRIDYLDDSKRLSLGRRQTVYESIRASGLSWSVGYATSREVDKHGLTVALRMASRRALALLTSPFDVVLLDGNYDYVNHGVRAQEFLKVSTCIKGDSLSFSMASASVMAKVSRDRYMSSHKEAPAYGWASSKGYATLEHIARVDALGLGSLHRRSFVITRK